MRGVGRFAVAGLLILASLPLKGEVSLSPSYDEASRGLRGGVSEFRLGRANQNKRRAIFRIISWNVQVFGSGLNPAREEAYRTLLDHMFSTKRSAKILAIQELSQEGGARKFETLLPGGAERWNRSFQDTSDSQDNGFFTQRQVTVERERFLFARPDESGRWRPDPGKALHPVRVASMRVGDFDFSLLTLHLTFQGGRTSESVRELKNVLDWLEAYFRDPGNDPDVIITGDFNMDSAAIKSVIDGYELFREKRDERGERVKKATELLVFVDAPTSRRGREPANNYDHFILSGDVYDEEFVRGSAGMMPANFIGRVEEAHGVRVSDHLPISAAFIYKDAGNDGSPIARDDSGGLSPLRFASGADSTALP